MLRRGWRDPDSSGSEEGSIALDALIALTLLGLLFPVVLASTQLSLRSEARAVERRDVMAQLGLLLTSSRNVVTFEEGRPKRDGVPFTLKLETSRGTENESGVALCEERAVATNAASRRTYRVETTKFCGGDGQ